MRGIYTTMKILIIEDDLSLQFALENAFRLEGYEVISCSDGDTGLYYIKENSCDFVILDWMLPEKTGPEILQEARTAGIMTPILLLTALDSISNKIEGLDCGADDYLTKPFDMRELLARVRAHMRRPVPLEFIEHISFGDLSYDNTSLKLTGPKSTIDVSKRLGDLIELFLKNGNTSLSRNTIFARIWGLDSDVDYAIIESYISFFRRRLIHLDSECSIKTIRGIGYSIISKNYK